MNELTVKEPNEMSAEELGSDIRLLTQQAKNILLNYGIQIGYRLYLAKEKVENFVEWVERETEFSKSSAYRYIQIYKEYGSAQSGLFGVENSFPTLGKVSISNALRLLAVPEEEREEFAAEVDAEHISARELEQAIRERDEAKKALQSTENELAASEKLRAELCDEGVAMRMRIKELESRPVEVAVQEDKEAIKKAAEEARKAAEKKTAGEIAGLKEKLKLAEQQRSAAEKEAKEAEKGGAFRSAEALRAKEKEVEELRRALAAAESGAGEVKIYCRSAQEAFFAALDKIAEIHKEKPDAAGKLMDGLTAIAEGLGEEIAAVKEKWG